MAKRFKLSSDLLNSNEGEKVSNPDPSKKVSPEKLSKQPDIPATRVMKENHQIKTIRHFYHALDPNMCDPSPYHDRIPGSMSEEKIKEYALSIWHEKQKEPVKARENENQPGRYWIDAGVSRTLACRYIKENMDAGFTVMATMEKESDPIENAFTTYIENEMRTQVTDFEKAYFFRKLLGLVKGIESIDSSKSTAELRKEIQDRFSVEKSKLSKMITAGEMYDYDDIMGLISDPAHIPVTKAYELMTTIKADKSLNQKVQTAVRALTKSGKQYTALDVLNKLMASVVPKKESKVVKFKDTEGKVTHEVMRDDEGNLNKLVFNRHGLSKGKDAVQKMLEKLYE